MSLVRTLTRQGCSRLHVFGVEEYASARGGDELFALINDTKPGQVLMESYSVTGDVAVGGALPYRSSLKAAGLTKALQKLADREFRASLTCEAVAVLSALRVGAELKFADRQQTKSFDRIVARVPMEELRQIVIMATEAFATALEGKGDSKDSATGSLGAQNLLCRFFPELWAERHVVMAHVAREAWASSRDADIILVLGAEHVEPVVRRLDKTEADQGVSVDELLRAPPAAADRSAELEKRSALAALLVSTQSFPPECVLPPPDQLDEVGKAVAQKVYPKYRWAIDGRLRQSSEGKPSAQDRLTAALQALNSCRGLGQLEELCSQLAAE
mmetsp:Transcript_14852/g.42079  ORF Transcript_14852/g.42079 Transcript_14852/m.42079 type:complete len:330 (-) Transcript_14852:92-1081(-)